jgi:AcrR family transcriptional regulator
MVEKSKSAKARSRPRRSQQERRRQTTANLLTAAADVLVDLGYARFTTEEVARRAGVSRGAQTNYFPTKRTLLIAVSQYVVDLAEIEARAFAARAQNADDVLAEFIVDAERFFLSRTYQAMIELHAAARTDRPVAAKLVPIARRSRKRLVRIWVARFVDTGVPKADAELIVQITNDFMRGLSWIAFVHSRKPELHLIGKWREILRGHLREQLGQMKPRRRPARR